MTVARVEATGSGPLAFRLEIEGFPFCFVTNEVMEQTDSDGREWVNGLQMKGVKSTQKADLPRAKLEAGGTTFKIADVGERVVEAFNTSPTATTWLAVACDDADTSITVKSTESFPSSGVLYLDSEVLSYASKTATTFDGLTRGIWSSLAQYHYVPDGAFLRFPAVTDQAEKLTGRRVRLWMYSAGDDLTGTGTQRWLGIVRGDPRCTGVTWSLLCDSIASVLEQEIGADLGEAATPRGVYLPPTGLQIGIGRTVGSGSVPVGSTSQIAEVYGFYETQAAFIAEMNAKLLAITTGWGAGAPSILCVASADGTYHFEIVQGATAHGIELRTYQAPACEPLFTPGTITSTADGPGPFIPVQLANTRYYCWPSSFPVPGAGLVPRGVFSFTTSLETDDAAALATYPRQRIYLGGSVGVAPNSTAAAVTWLDGASSEERTYSIVTSSTPNRSIDLTRRFGRTYELVDDHVYTPANLPTVRLGRSYNTTGTDGVADLMRTLELGSAEQVNTGAQPMVRTGDYDFSAWTDAYAGVLAVARSRFYDSFKPGKLIDFIAPDLMLAGLYLAFDSAGRLTLKRLRLPSPTETGVYDITRSTLVTKTLPRYERGAIGAFASVTIKDGYDALTDKYLAPSHTPRDVTAYGQDPTSRTLLIESKSAGAVPITAADAVAIADGVLGIYGQAYAYITCEVDFRAMGVTIGDAVTITTGLLPSSAGIRGVSDLVALETSRELEWYTGRIALTLLATPRRIAGYAPAALITDHSEVGDGEWEITLSSAYFATGDDAADHLNENDRVEIYRFDSLTAGVVGGRVVGAVVGNVVTVAIDTIDPDDATNLLPAPASVTWTPSGAVVTTGQADPLGGTNATSLQDDSAAAQESARTDLGTYVSGSPVAAEVWLKKDAGATSFPGLKVIYGGSAAASGVVVNIATGAAEAWGGGTYAAVDVVEAITGWWRVRFTHGGGVGATAALWVYPAAGTTYPTQTSTALGTVTVYAPRIVYLAWVPGSDEWVLTAAPSNTDDLQTGQKRYAYVAAADGTIDFGTETANAFTVSP